MSRGDVTWNATVKSTCEGHKPGSLCWVNIVWTREPLTHECYSEISNKYWQCLSVGWPGRKRWLKGACGIYWSTCREYRRVRGVKTWMVYRLAASSGVSYGVLMLLLGCEGISLLQLRWLMDEVWIGSDKHDCVSTNKWEFGLLLHTKIMQSTLFGSGPWSLCCTYGNTLRWKDCKWTKHRSETYSNIFKLKHK